MKHAGRMILELAGPGDRVATFLTPRVAYYAHAEDVQLHRFIGVRAGVADPGWLRTRLAAEADWLAVVPGRLDERVRPLLLTAAGGLVPERFGEGEWEVLVFRLRR